MTHEIETVFYNLWSGGKLADMVKRYRITLSERFNEAVSVGANNLLFLEHYNGYCNKKGFKYCDMWLRGLLADYVKRSSLNDGDAPYNRQYYYDWLNNTRWISRNNTELREWCDDYERFLNDNVFKKIEKDAVNVLHDAFVEFYRFYDHAADVSSIPSDGNRDEVTTQLSDVLEWCNHHDKELKTQLANWPLQKDVEELRVLANYIIDNFDNWSSVIGYDAITMELFNDIAKLLDNVIDPSIKQRNPTQKSQLDFSHMKSFKLILHFEMSELYSFLISEGVIKGVDEESFSYCISHADINKLWGNCKRAKLKLVISHLKIHYEASWYDTVCANLKMKKQDMGKFNVPKRKEFESKITMLK